MDPGTARISRQSAIFAFEAEDLRGRVASLPVRIRCGATVRAFSAIVAIVSIPGLVTEAQPLPDFARENHAIHNSRAGHLDHVSRPLLVARRDASFDIHLVGPAAPGIRPRSP